MSIFRKLYLIVLSAALAIFTVATISVFHNHDTLVEERIQQLKYQVDVALSIVEHHKKRAESGEITPEEAYKAWTSVIRDMRYGDGEYLFVYEGTIARVLGVKKELEGKDLKDVKGPLGDYVVRDIDEAVKAGGGEAVHAYKWGRYGSDDPVDKISYIKMVPGTNLWLGTGVYVDDLDVAFYDAVMTTVIETICITLILIGIAHFIALSITRPIDALKQRMKTLSDGDHTTPVPGLALKHEVGAMADAVEVFRANAERMVEMAAEQRATEERAARELDAAIKGLVDAFGAVAASAAQGDFSARVTTRFERQELNEVASDFNKIMEIIEAGLGETRRVMSHLANGDLTHQMTGDFVGEYAELQSNVNETIERLNDLIFNIASTTETVSKGADEISTGASDLSRRAEQQASSLEETAATMEEMAASIKANADGARSADNLAADATSQARAGGEIVTSAASAMNEIEESASKISDIITVIDGIAFQTNLLALNAAVEAARAGDAGKGFAVVASEVRALAQRSSEASCDIRQLIEKSAGQVSTGVKLVTEAGASLEDIVASISRVEEAIKCIATASSEQASGVEEISSTVSHMDQMTQQNSSMADRSASSARMLAGGAEKLKHLVDFFSLDEKAPEQSTDAA